MGGMEATPTGRFEMLPADDYPDLGRNAYRVDFTSGRRRAEMILATSPRVARLIAEALYPEAPVDRVTLAS